MQTGELMNGIEAKIGAEPMQSKDLLKNEVAHKRCVALLITAVQREYGQHKFRFSGLLSTGALPPLESELFPRYADSQRPHPC